MLHGRQRKVDRQNGERIDQQLVLSVNDAMHLFLRTILGTQKTRTLGYRLGINLGTRRTNTRRIPLCLQRDGICHQFARLNLLQVAIALANIVPRLQLTMEETQEWRFRQRVVPTLLHLLACLQLYRTQAVLIQVVGIDFVNREGCIGIAAPTATEV